MSKNNEILIIIKNVKKYLIFFIILNLIVLGSFTYFYSQTKSIKSEFVDIKFVTNDFPTIQTIFEDIKFYIEFTSDYTFDIDKKTFVSDENSSINLENLKNKLDNYFLDYHNNLNDHASKTQYSKDYQTLSLVNYYFSKINLFEKVYKLDDLYSNYKYNKINYITILFSLFIFLNFFLYIFFLFLQYLKKNK